MAALTHYERTKRWRLRKAGLAVPPTPKQERAEAIRRMMAEHAISRRTAYYRLAKQTCDLQRGIENDGK